ncbi:MAG: NAD(+) synthase [Phycisphaerales bacterium]|jgi:NAD+ synthetase|nr:NAD(+) synthase [Phycisphaerales bacterium]
MRIALCPVNPTVGDPEGNARLCEDAIGRAREAGADLAMLPELVIAGYPPRDLLRRASFVRACANAAKSLGERATRGISVALGCPLPLDHGLGVANGLVVFRDGAMVAYHDKRLLPTYDVFDEARYFEAGDRAVVVEIPSRDGAVTRVGLAICEDLWRGEDALSTQRYEGTEDPVGACVLAGARVIVAASASPFVIGKHARQMDVLRGHAARHGVVVCSVNQMGGNDDLVFDGSASAHAAGGGLAGENRRFSGEMLVVEVGEDGGARVIGGAARAETSTESSSDSSDRERLGGEAREVFDALVVGTRDYVRKTGHSSAIVGLSGGIDSALTCVIAARALGAENVTGVLMPSRYSSGHSVEDARDLAVRLGVRALTIQIEDAVNTLRAGVSPALHELGQVALGGSSAWGEYGREVSARSADLPVADIADENVQSRVRGTIVMALSNRTGAMVLTTGNKSEYAVGYCTLYGDMNGGLAVLLDLCKTRVYALSRWINANAEALDYVREPIPTRTIEKAPSAELRPDQTDQDSLPAYDVLDRVMEAYVERGEGAEKILSWPGCDADAAKKVLRLLRISEFKRFQAPVGIKLTRIAFGPGRRYPLANRWEA